MAKHAAHGVELGDLDIAIIDDNEAMAIAMCSILEGVGVARTRAFRNSDMALGRLIDSPPHIVMLDCREATGRGTLDVRAIRARSAAPLSLAAVIAMSAEASESLVREAFLAGANQFLAKPVAPTTVLGRLVWLQRDDSELVAEGDHYVVAHAGQMAAGRCSE